MLFSDTLCIIRGGGDLATGVIHRLHHAGFRLIVLELDKPRVVRRMASVAQAMFSAEIQVGDLAARRMTLEEAIPASDSAIVPVVADPDGAAITQLKPSVIVDARMAKTPLDTAIDAAPPVIGLGPGFVAGRNCYAIVETNRGHDLGRVLWQGAAQPNTGRPEAVMGYEGVRVLRAPAAGALRAHKEIGDIVQKDDPIASVDRQAHHRAFYRRTARVDLRWIER